MSILGPSLLSLHFLLFLSLPFPGTAQVQEQGCPEFSFWARNQHEPFSSGHYNLSYQRPDPACRTFNSSGVESTIQRLKSKISDPDLFRLFENAYPSTLDTCIKWRGYANGTDEELAFLITGDINAMWLRDSANQIMPYLPLLKPDTSNNSIASIYRGVINLQARYILISPYCNAFQAPDESEIPPQSSQFNNVYPSYSTQEVFECKWELDSLSTFLQISSQYHKATDDVQFFKKYSWPAAVDMIMTVATDMQTPTYDEDGKVLRSPYTFTGSTTRGSETLWNDGLGNPVANGTGLVRCAFRPSDDTCIYQLFIPANMQFAVQLVEAAEIMDKINSTQATRMRNLASTIKKGIEAHGIVRNPEFGDVYAYEVDGYGSTLIMDDANVPSLLSAPFLGYLDMDNEVYQNTRKLLLSPRDPYWAWGPVISGIGSPHTGPGKAWPMASIIRIMTSSDDKEIVGELKQILSSTNGLGLVHESINTYDASQYSREWFSWANGLFAQMILDIEKRKPDILSQSFQ